MRIGEAAAAAGLTPRALRYYEQRGLLAARRSASGYREYGPEDVRLLGAVRELLAAGLTIADVQAIVPYLDAVRPDGGQGRCEAAQVLVGRRLAELDRRIARLTELRERLAAGIGESLRRLGGPGGPGGGSGQVA
ncbi:MAG: hypothetical protein QOI83_231 [Streptomycetaceae bacterium]|jgi:DNA-binding transcriptional MerR regulator|nr:hypothetical protein [Streptomycetaceae bacterium]